MTIAERVALPVACEFEGRRIYTPLDWRKSHGGSGYPEGLAPMKRHRRCVECGGYLQGEPRGGGGLLWVRLRR